MISYWTDVILLQLCFGLFFEFFLKNMPLHNWNRLYLLATPLLALLLPKVKLGFMSEVSAGPWMVALNEVVVVPEKAVGTLSGSTATTGGSVLTMIWATGAVLYSFFLVYKITNLYRIINRGKKERKGRYTLVVLPHSFEAFSFWRFICVGDQLPEKHLPAVIDHEMKHLQLRHSIDLVYFELLKLVFWFNPLHWFFQKRITAVHEFQVDNQTQVFPFETVLIRYFEVSHLPLTHSFFKQSLIKKRLIMLRKHISPTHKFIRLVLLLPLLSAMLFYVSCKQEKRTVSEQLDQIAKDLEARDSALTQEETNKLFKLFNKNYKDNRTVVSITQIEKLDDGDSDSTVSVPFAVIDEVPIFPGCEDVSIDEQRDCFQNKMNEHIRTHFQYPELAQKMGITGRVYVQFTINEEGKIEGIRMRGPDPMLEAEAGRILSLLPDQFTPGRQKGEAVKVPYSIPINFQLK